MKLFLMTLCLIMAFYPPALSQEKPVIKGNPITEIFADFHYYNNSDSGSITGFGLTRAYLGYNFIPGGNIYGTVILNVGSPSELSYGAKERRYSFFREASVTWSKKDLTMSFGMTTTRALLYQQRWLGKRYVADNFEAINGYATVADLGVSADYRINDLLQADFTLMNGEGYNGLHIDRSLKTSLGLNITPGNNLLIRMFGDTDRPGGVRQHTLIGFIGFKNTRLTAGVEAAYKSNIGCIPGNDSRGASGTCVVRLMDKAGLFGRYDFVAFEPSKSQYQFAVAGFEYVIASYLKLAIDYQGTYGFQMPDSHGIFLNAHFRIWETVSLSQR